MPSLNVGKAMKAGKKIVGVLSYFGGFKGSSKGKDKKKEDKEVTSNEQI